MKKSGLVTAVLMYAMLLNASTKSELAVKFIPDSLIAGASTVLRSGETNITITSPSQAEYEIHQVVTILNESGARDLVQSFAYNQFVKIKDFHVNVYDRDGVLLSRHKLSDMKDISMYDGFSLYTDTRLKFLQVNGGQYPVTIEWEVTIDYNGIFDLPDWYIQRSNQSVEAASLMVEAPHDIDIHFRSYNISLPADIKKEKKNTYKWTVSRLKALKVPSESYNESFFYPCIDLSPSKYEIAGYKGSLDSWDQFGAGLAEMWHGKRDLPPAAVAEIENMVKNTRTDHEKIEILYDYLQKNFHYVNVVIGISGCIPIDAATVHRVKYGDCKALSNYMCAILDVVGIKSYPVLINAGRNEHPIDTTFPSSHFNHAILYAEADGKPLWLECTSTALPAGELGDFTENRYGLMIVDTTGMIIATPPSDPELNVSTLSSDVRLTRMGQATIKGYVSLSGENTSNAKSSLKHGTEKEQASYLFTILHIKQPGTFKLNTVKDTAGIISVDINGQSDNLFDFKTDNKSFLPSTFISSWYRNITANNDRKDDLLIDFPFCKKESLVYHIDSTMSLSLPGDFDLDNAMVYFHRKVEKMPDNTVTLKTEFKMKKHIVHPEEVALLKESLQKVNKYLQQKVIVEAKQ